MPRHPPNPDSRLPGPASGFTLLEVLIALTLLTGSLLVAFQVMGVAAKATESARATTLGTTLASQKIEQLRALGWGMASDGTPAEDFDSDAARWPVGSTGGNGLAPSAPGTLATDTPGYVDYLDVRGQWIGAGGSPPGPAAFTRRWSVEPGGAAFPATLLLRVVVLRRGAATRGGGANWVPIAELDAAKARRGE